MKKYALAPCNDTIELLDQETHKLIGVVWFREKPTEREYEQIINVLLDIERF